MEERLGYILAPLRKRYSIPQGYARWPDGTPMDVLLHLHRLLDIDDVHLEMVVAAVNCDCSNATLQGVYPAMRAAEILRSPGTAREYLLAQFPLVAAAPFLRCLRLGLLPFGVWAIVAACSVQSPRVTPETRSMLAAVQDPSPALSRHADDGAQARFEYSP